MATNQGIQLKRRLVLEQIFYIEQIHDLVEFIKNELDKIEGVADYAVGMRVLNNLNVYIFVGHEAAKRAANDEDEVLPAEVGLKFDDPALNQKRHSRLWLQEYWAEVVCKMRARETYPQLAIEWLCFIQGKDSVAVVTLLKTPARF